MNRLCVCCAHWLLLLFLLPALAGCDGGIFGTGDGSETLATVDAADPGNDVSGGAPTGTDSDAEPGAMPDGPEDNTSTETRAFENLLVTGSVSDPRIVLVNLSSQSLTARAGADNQGLFASPIVSGTTSPRVPVPMNTTEITVLEEDGSRRLLILSPLNLGAYSVTTLIARDRPLSDAQASENTATGASLPAVEISALATRLSADASDVAGIRLLQADRLGDDDSPARMSLVPAGATPGSSQVNLDNVSAATFGHDATYRVAAPGSYVLSDSRMRFEPIPLTIAAAQTYTLIITGTPARLYIVHDSAPPVADASRERR